MNVEFRNRDGFRQAMGGGPEDLLHFKFLSVIDRRRPLIMSREVAVSYISRKDHE